jgi:uncharacterized peroxidase-related enzyme
MAYLTALAPDAVLLDVFRKFGETSKPLLAYHEALLRGPSPLSVAERELIAGFVSGLNNCSYCHGVHEATAREFGVPADLMAQMLANLDHAPVADNLKPILRYVHKLTVSPSRMTKADADAVFAAGWNDQALHDAVSVCALFNLMNRLVEGLGIRAGDPYFALAAKRLHEVGYKGLLEMLP